MDMEAGKTLTNEEVIRELLDLLKKNAMKEQANDVFEICSYVDGLEKKIDSMTEELTNMQNQIKEMQEDTLVNNAKKALSEAQEQLNARCEQIKSQVLEVKVQVKSTAKSIVDEAKAKDFLFTLHDINVIYDETVFKVNTCKSFDVTAFPLIRCHSYGKLRHFLCSILLLCLLFLRFLDSCISISVTT